MAAAGIGVVLGATPDGKVNQPESHPALSHLVVGRAPRSHETKDRGQNSPHERTPRGGNCVLLESKVFIGT
jgi:hypothetical protein